MATGGGNFQPALLSENPQAQEQIVEKALAQAEQNGADAGENASNLTDAHRYLAEGQEALKKGQQAEASRDFRAAELALNVPVEVGYAEVWESEIPIGDDKSMGGSGLSSAEPGRQQQSLTPTQPESSASTQQESSESGMEQPTWTQSKVENLSSRCPNSPCRSSFEIGRWSGFPCSTPSSKRKCRR
jgi:hypothetical protein